MRRKQAIQTIFPQQSGYPVLSHLISEPSQHSRHSRTAIAVMCALLDASYLLHQLRFLFLSFTTAGFSPPIVSTARYVQYFGHPLHAVGSPLHLDEPKLHRFALEKMASAFRRISLSSRNNAFSFRSRACSSSLTFPFPGNARIPSESS